MRLLHFPTNERAAAIFHPASISRARAHRLAGRGWARRPVRRDRDYPSIVASPIVSTMKRSLIALSLLSPVPWPVQSPPSRRACTNHDPKSYAVSTDARGISNNRQIVGVFYDRFENP